MNREAREQAGNSEDDLLAAIRKLLSGDAPGVVLGAGDDAAIVEPNRHPGLLTSDLLVEDVHFRLGITSAHDLGVKAIAVNVSDVAAMGGSPRYALVSLGFPPDLGAPFAMELYGGMLQAAEEYGLVIVGGDLSRSEKVVVSVAVVGEVAEGRAVRREGARPGDRVVVSGVLGAAAGGLRLTAVDPAGAPAALGSEWAHELLAAHFRPVARVGEGQTLAQAGATAMMDVSDGLALDLGRLCRESEVGATIREDRIPVAPGLAELAAIVDADPLELALHGGEDYELLATLPGEAVSRTATLLQERFGTPLTDIGEVTDSGLVLVGADGVERPLAPTGWDHFAG